MPTTERLAGQPAEQPTIGFLLKTYPKLSETFILNEILELERQGLKLHIFSLRRPKSKKVHPSVAQVQAPVTYLPSLLPDPEPEAEAELLRTQQQLLEQDISAYRRAFEFYLERQEERQLHEFLQGAWLGSKLQQLGIRHLHVHFANVPTATAEIAQIFSGVPYSITAHAKDIYLSDRAALDRRMSKAEFVLTCTDFNRQYLEEVSSSSTPIHLAYHGLDIQRFQPESDRWPRPSAVAQSADAETTESQTAVPQILSVGRFCEKKGFPYLIKACQLLKQIDQPFHCNIVGYGPLEAEIRQQIDELGLSEQITLVGKLTQDRLVNYYRQSDLFVLPCLVTDDGDRDGIPNVLLEAMAMEIPVVSTRVSGITELVQTESPEQTGLLVPEKDAAALAAAMRQLLRSPQQQQLGQASRRRVMQMFGLANNVGQVKDWLLEAVAEPSQPRSPQTQRLTELLALATA